MLFPDLTSKIRTLEFVTTRKINTLFAGNYKSSFRGKGIEFDEVREYEEGDDIRDIDWNITAREGKPFIKKYVESRELSTVLIVDLSGSVFFGSTAQLKRDVIIDICAILAFSALKNNDQVGLLIFTNQKEVFIPPKKGRGHVMRILRTLLGFPKNQKPTDIKSSLIFLNQVVKRHAVCFIISDFIGIEAEYEYKLTGKRNDLIALMIRDSLEQNLPDSGLIAVQNSEGEDCMIIDSGNARIRNEYTANYQKEIMKQKNFFQKMNVDQAEFFTHEDPYVILKKLFKKRMKKIGR